MKFIISENRVYDYILKYINSKYEPDKINWSYAFVMCNNFLPTHTINLYLSQESYL